MLELEDARAITRLVDMGTLRLDLAYTASSRQERTSKGGMESLHGGRGGGGMSWRRILDVTGTD